MGMETKGLSKANKEIIVQQYNQILYNSLRQTWNDVSYFNMAILQDILLTEKNNVQDRLKSTMILFI